MVLERSHVVEIATGRVLQQPMRLRRNGVTVDTRRKEGITIVRTSFFSTDVGGCRERFWEACIVARRVENARAPRFALIHDC